MTLFLILTALLFFAIIGGIAGILIESAGAPDRRARHNPALHDALWALAGWAFLGIVYLAIEWVDYENLTLEFRHLLGALLTLPLYHALLSTLRLIYMSVRRIHARLRGGAYVPRPIPFLAGLAAPTLFIAAIGATITEFVRDRFSLYFFLLLSVSALLAFMRKRAPQ